MRTFSFVKLVVVTAVIGVTLGMTLSEVLAADVQSFGPVIRTGKGGTATCIQPSCQPDPNKL